MTRCERGFLLLGAWLLSGCAGDPAPSATPTPRATAGPSGFTRASAPVDPRIHYSGRVRFDASGVSFDWPGVSVALVAAAAAVGFELEDEGRGNHFNLFVDDELRQVWRLEQGVHIYSVEGLGAGSHRLRLSKRTEALQGVTSLRRLWLSADGSLLPPAPLPTPRRLEIVGASWVAGYGNEGETYESCPDLEAVSNSWEAFGAIVARRLRADYHVVAVSGQGVVRNSADPEPVSAEPFPAQYGRLLWNDRASTWDPSSWLPDAVIVDLGINDHTTEPRPPAASFRAGYAAFLARLRAQYPEAHIFCVNVTDWPHFSHLVVEVVEALRRSGDSRLSFTGIPSFPRGEMGCDWHPKVAGHHAIADVLTPVVAATLGWD